MLGGATKALSFLLSTGFIAGFALSSGHTRLLLHNYTRPAQAVSDDGDAPGGGDEQAGKGAQRGSVKNGGSQTRPVSGNGTGDGSSAQTASKDATLEDDGGGDAPGSGSEKGSAGNQQSGAGEKAAAGQAPKDAKRAVGSGHAGAGSPPTAADETSASFLVGNTMQATQAEQTTIRYLSSKRWMGEQTNGSLVVRRWVVQNGQLCLVSALNAAICETLNIVREAKPERGTGAVLGSVTSAAGVRWTVRRGNTAAIPEMIPLIIGEQSAAAEAAPAKPSAVGQAAVAAMIGRTLVNASDKAALLGERYEPDGLWVNAQPLDPAAKTGLGGVRVSVGRWRFVAGLLCVDQPGLEVKTDCAVPEQWGKQTFRLRSVRPERVTTMVGVASL